VEKTTFAVIGKSDDAHLLAQMLGCQMNRDADVLIRYGNRDPFKGEIEINTIPALENARHKYKSLEIFTKKKLPVPKFALKRYDLRSPMLGRRFHHQCGTDIIFIKTKKEPIRDRDYFIEFLPVQTEYRAHIVCGQVISLAEKVGGRVEGVYCRNLRTGWTFEERRPEDLCHPDIVKMSKKAVKVLGLHFGAVDILISKGKPFLLEVNTAPGIIERRAKLYATSIKGYVGRL
jgi:hypothetical protein